MLDDAIRKWNPWWAEGRVSPNMLGANRDKLKNVIGSLSTGLIKALIGPRRAGKTTLLYQTIEHLIEKGVPSKNIVFLNFDDNNIFNSDLDALITQCKKINPSFTHLFLDEVQEKKDWDRWIRTLYDTRQFSQIFVTGSSTSLLEKEVSDVLAGRHVSFRVLPFSFKEFLSYSGWTDMSQEKLEHQKDLLLHYLQRYIKFGGYPEALSMDEGNRVTYLNDLFGDMIARDVAARHKADHNIAKRIAYYMVSNSSRTLTHRSISNACGVAQETVSKYLAYLEEAGMVHPLRMFSFKLKEQMREINKYYVIDTGLANAVSFKFSDDTGRMFENLVFLELLGRYQDRAEFELFYYTEKDGKEVDFIIKEKERVTGLVQACWDMTDEKTRKREVSAALRAMEDLDVPSSLIITENHEGVETLEGKTITYLPVWKWMLQR